MLLLNPSSVINGSKIVSLVYPAHSGSKGQVSSAEQTQEYAEGEGHQRRLETCKNQEEPLFASVGGMDGLKKKERSGILPVEFSL